MTQRLPRTAVLVPCLVAVGCGSPTPSGVRPSIVAAGSAAPSAAQSEPPAPQVGQSAGPSTSPGESESSTGPSAQPSIGPAASPTSRRETPVPPPKSTPRPTNRPPATTRPRPTDSPEPTRCADVAFTTSPITASTLDEFEAGIVGTWQGCVTTPGWVPKDWVTMTFRSDGTYSARSDDVLDGQDMIAMYYGMDEDSPNKVCHLVDVHDDGTASGTIDIVFDVGSVNRDEIRQIR